MTNSFSTPASNPGSSRERYVVLGAGQAAACAAVAIREAGFAGELTVIGDEADYPYERPPLSKEILVGSESIPRPVYEVGRYGALGIRLELGLRAEAIDAAAGQLILQRGVRIPYDRLLLATGARPRRLQIPGGEHILYLRGFSDAAALRDRLLQSRRILLIGAGVLGLEIASSARKRGVDVLIVEAGARPLGRCMAATEAEFLAARHAANGVEIRSATQLLSIRPISTEGSLDVDLSDGRTERVDCVAAAIGVVPNVELAADAGLTVKDGIVVDGLGRTSHDGIFAAGDVARFPHPLYDNSLRLESFFHAQNHAICVGKAMCGSRQAYRDIPRFWTDQLDLNVQVAGLPSDELWTVVRGSRDAARFTAFQLTADQRVAAATAVNSARDIRPAMALIEARAEVDAAALTDLNVPLRRLADAAATS